MDKKIAVIEDNISKLSDALGCIGIEYNNQTEDNQIHDWLIPKILALKDVEKIIIPIRLGIDDADFKGLRIGLHIRLSVELGDIRFLPIIFIAEESRDLILNNQIKGDKERSAMLLFTPGVYLTPISELLPKLERFDLIINRKILLLSVLPNLIIENQRDLGHQLANEWGVFRLAKFAGIQLNINPPRDLYFKYKYAYSETDIKPEVKSSIGLINSNCKILLIDDNADKGWTELLKEIVQKRILSIGKKCDFETIQTFEVADNKSDYEKYDIVFLDLRLKPEEDKPNAVLPIEEYSGYKLLKKIKAINQGIQVIILTASNKAWNMKRLLDEGADGYYIKESPDFNFPDSFSEQNYDEFKKCIEDCFERNHLKDIFIKTRILKNTKLQIKNTNNDRFADFKQVIKQNLNLAYILLKDKHSIDFAIFNYIQILETYCNFFTLYNSENKKAIVYKNYLDKKNRKNEVLIFETKNERIYSNFKYEKDFYPFQKNMRGENNKQFVNYIYESADYEIDARFFSFALKLAAVLNTQLHDLSQLRKLMELIFIRNNKIAHSGQNFDITKREIQKEDIVSIFSTINRLLNISL
jgi:CheY-like chemotaxis protein